MTAQSRMLLEIAPAVQDNAFAAIRRRNMEMKNPLNTTISETRNHGCLDTSPVPHSPV